MECGGWPGAQPAVGRERRDPSAQNWSYKMADQDPGGISPLQQMVASGAGAVVTSLFMTPLDVVKVRLQSQRPSLTSELMPPSRLWSFSYAKLPSSLRPTGKCLLYCNGVLEPLYLCPNSARCATWFQDPTRFTGTMDAFVKIVRHEGTRTLWSGLPATLVMTVPATAIYFTAYDQLKAFLCGRALTSDFYAPMVAGALARLGTVTVISPLELIRTKLQAQHVSYRELGACVRAAVAQGGWRSLWLGWGPTALRDVPFSGGCHPDSTLRCGEDSAPGCAGSSGGCESVAPARRLHLAAAAEDSGRVWHQGTLCRLPPTDHQGCPLLCHHDQHLRVGQKLLSEAQPGTASGPVREARG
ncbi:PREDICTED: solute carrier family 25 member 39 isoform X3 [Miniopterus natalensis]|uniref:solute carrier family 25 member 39 isoform X3 n=1 Tax=Miniopterus natalensis TaxID=291302 RepID=UPI0007A6C34A|nr:PREDICTED: solute carrier family 25 member 39 isoform X3 [Miniopterus natalensis]